MIDFGSNPVVYSWISVKVGKKNLYETRRQWPNKNRDEVNIEHICRDS